MNKNITCASCLGCSVLAGIICVFIFGAGIVGVGIVAENVAEHEKNMTPAEKEDRELSSKKVSAWVAVQQFVKKKAQSPSSVRFPGWIHTDDRIESLGNDRYRSVGKVEYKNAFGVVLESEFICEVIDKGNENWSCTLLEFKE